MKECVVGIIICGTMRLIEKSSIHELVKVIKKVGFTPVIYYSGISPQSNNKVNVQEIKNIEEYPLKKEYTHTRFLKAPETNIYNVLSMYYHREKISKIVKEEEVYIVWRSDFSSNDLEKIEYILKNMHDEVVYIPEGNDWRNGINDQMALGKGKIIKKYLECYSKIFVYLSRGCIFHPENLLKHHLEYNDVKIERFKIDYSIIRGNLVNK